MRSSVGYGDKIVLDRLSLRLDPDDRVALLGRNGNGKSTFAKLIAGRLVPLAGELVRARGLKVGFFAQHQIEDLEPTDAHRPRRSSVGRATGSSRSAPVSVASASARQGRDAGRAPVRRGEDQARHGADVPATSRSC